MIKAPNFRWIKVYVAIILYNPPNPLSVLIFYVAYVLTVGLGQGLAIIPGVSITFWPPAGVFLATLLLNRKASWPYFIFAAWLAELTCNLVWFHNPFPYACLYFLANTLEALTAVALLRHFVGPTIRMESMREVAHFVALAGLLAPVVGATIIALIDEISGKHPYEVAWPLVWLGDGSGLLVSTPLTLVIIQTWRERSKIQPRRATEFIILLLLLFLVTVAAMVEVLPTPYLAIPILLWAALRFRIRGGAVAIATVTLILALMTAAGKGRYVSDSVDPEHSMVILQSFLAVSTISTLLVAALSQQYQRAIEDVRHANLDLEQRVAERTERLQTVDKRKDEFLATLAHELRNPLSPIATGIEILKRNPSKEDQITVVDSMSRQLGHLVHLVDDLLDISRVKNGRIILRQEIVDLKDAISTAIETCQPLIDEKNHHLTTALPPHPLLVQGDQTRIVQMIANLLTNAAKYTDPGGKIHIELLQLQSESEIIVTDNGTGIEPQNLDTLWDMFTQVRDTIERAQGGLGIGLSLTKRLAELHGGTVTAHSDGPNTGATFRLKLPLITPAKIPSPANTST